MSIPTPFQIWISGKLMEQINLEPLQILRLSNTPEEIFDMTPEELEQLMNKITPAWIAEIEKRAFEKLRHPCRESLRDYIEK